MMIKIFTLTFFFFCLHFFLLGKQSPEQDSIKYLLNELPSGIKKVSALNRLTFLLREIDINQALAYGELAETMAVEYQDSLGLGRAKGNMGWIFYRMGNWEKAFKYSRDAFDIGIKQNDRKEIAMVLNNLGALY